MSAKRNAALKALEFVEGVLGVGSGSTASEFIKLLKEKKGEFEGIVVSSEDSKKKVIKEGLGRYLMDLEEIDKIDVYVDGADSVLQNCLIKGGGGALLKEKILAYESKKFVVIVDESKLGREFPVPVEVVPFAHPFLLKKLREFGKATLREGSGKIGPVITENGNYIIDVLIKNNICEQEKKINELVGVVENGIFSKFDSIIVGSEKGAYFLEEIRK